MSYLGDVLHPALPVKPLSDSLDESKPPATAEEYLQRVVLEAALREDVVVAEVNRTLFARKQTAVFQNPDQDDDKSWLLFCPGTEIQISLLDKEMINSGPKAIEGQPSLIITILSMNQPIMKQILDYQINWLQEST